MPAVKDKPLMFGDLVNGKAEPLKLPTAKNRVTYGAIFSKEIQLVTVMTIITLPFNCTPRCVIYILRKSHQLIYIQKQLHH